MLYALNSTCPVKWTAVQERSLSRDFPGPSTSRNYPENVGEGSSRNYPQADDLNPFQDAGEGEDYVKWMYARWLWLPESVAPLHRLSQALYALKHTARTDVQLHTRLASILRTPRAISEKYRGRVPSSLDAAYSSTSTDDPHTLAQTAAQSRSKDRNAEDTSIEDEVMFYGLKYDVGYDWYQDTEHEADGQADEVSDDKWRDGVVRKVERREVLIQILLHFVMLSLPLPEPVLSPSSPRKRKIIDGSPVKPRPKTKTKPERPTLDREYLEEHLEMFMDKLAMWQLTRDIDSDLSKSNMKGKGKAKEDVRDWMQRFCEDIVEPTFKNALPTQCALLRSKVFQASPFSESELDLSDSDDGTSAKAGPSAKSKSTREKATRRVDGETKSTTLQRTRSLSVSLQEEYEQRRSRSLSIGPGGDGMKKRALAREVSMSVAFKGKAPVQNQSRGAIGRSQSRVVVATQSKTREKIKEDGGKKGQGTTLVEATPSKPRKHSKLATSQASLSQSLSQAWPPPSSRAESASQGLFGGLGSQARIFVNEVEGDTDVEDDEGVVVPCTPTPKANARALLRGKAPSAKAVEGDADDDAWMVQSSPDVLLLGDSEAWEHMQTPTKKRRV